MIVNEVDVKVNVLILSMEHEIDVLIQTVETLSINIEDDVTVSILLNGGSSKRLRDLFSKIPFLKYYEVPENLGVAGGRMFLFNTDEFKTADMICILDNDVVVPTDYLREIVTGLLSNNKIGVVGAIVMDIKEYIEKLESYKNHTGIFGNKTYKISCQDLKRIFLTKPSSKGLYHIGTYKNWFLTYISPIPLFFPLINKVFEKYKIDNRFNVNLKDNTQYIKKIINGEDKFEVANIAGCSQSFKKSLIDQIGQFDTIFNPYGLEDVDFNVRAIKSHYKNFTLGNVWLLHGTDLRHKSRNLEIVVENYYRVLTIFAYKHTNRFIYKFLVISKIYINRLLMWMAKNKNGKKYFQAQIKGYKEGLRQIKKLGEG